MSKNTEYTNNQYSEMKKRMPRGKKEYNIPEEGTKVESEKKENRKEETKLR